MEEKFKEVKSITDQKYILETNPAVEEEYYEMSWTGRQIYKLMQEQQPERFAEMQQSKTLIPFIEKHAHQWFLNMEDHIQKNGLAYRHEAEELEWNNLIEAVGLK
ncbi:hypothetical protein SAMN05192529_11771 [Arachidicoccus rhizosphaerae]|uniref:Transposon-encoded protein TnpV n=1 Tax=Arachidicoccus rhizosphaerae TaxID=551991 RepID=A0A1H4B0A7_9BACT|nr:hypothetical protein [Arachidicoccus rhizosphaerae]SEA41526.1 hypothetical protein SAMN05192529_11771 [Arachidicoccus rhizosphaerae]